MIVRLFLGAGLFALGYFVGKEVGRAESVREELRRAREEAALGEEEGLAAVSIGVQDADA